MTSPARRAFRWVMWGLALYPVIAFCVGWFTPLGVLDAVLLVFLVELLPILAFAQLPMLDESEPLARLPVYLSSVVAIVGLGGAATMVGWAGLGPEAMGLRWTSTKTIAAWVALLTIVAGGILAAFWGFRRVAGIRESPLLIQLLPRSSGEKAAFAGLSVAAGLGEELAYRGYLVPALTILLGWQWGAVVLSSVAFGVMHAYQGWLGMVRTAALGLLLAGSFVVTGTIWPAVIAHGVLDLLAGLVIGDRLTRG